MLCCLDYYNNIILYVHLVAGNALYLNAKFHFFNVLMYFIFISIMLISDMDLILLICYFTF